MSSSFRQTFFIPPPTLTEKNCPNQSGKIHIVTGGYSGLGRELVNILYQHHATVYIVGRDENKATAAISSIKESYPHSTGRLEFLFADFSDLTTIKLAVDRFLLKEKHLHVLTLNAGVMFVPKSQKSPQDYDMQIATNCLGPHLFYKMLRPILISTAKNAPPASVRVTWAGSIAIDGLSPPGGMKFIDGTNEPSTAGDEKVIYGITKVGNLWLANVHGRRDAEHNILHVCWNPGNLKTDLTRHTDCVTKLFFLMIMNPPVFGGYTELYSALSEDLTMDHVGAYIIPWGQVGKPRKDVADNCLPTDQGGQGGAERFVKWCEEVTGPFEKA